MILVTGGAGFIGSNFICDWLARHDEPILNLDALTYAGNLDNLKEVEGDNRHTFVHGNILDEQLLINLFNRFHPRAVIHFAAESHVDRSIVNPSIFVDTNVKGTTTLLNVALHYWKQLNPEAKKAFRFINISTDEVYGSLSEFDAPRTENDSFNPSSPYSASKAAADHFGRAYSRTYHLPVITIRCTNNFGPKQNLEKFVPKTISNILNKECISIYGNGLQIRDWIYVSDFCRGIEFILSDGISGEVYNISTNTPLSNIDLAKKIFHLFQTKENFIDKLQFIKDRPGHDFRYSLNCNKIKKEIGWVPLFNLSEGLKFTINWYKNKRDQNK